MLNSPDRSKGGCQPWLANTSIVFLVVAWVLVSVPVLAADPPEQDHALGRPGYLVIEAARDSSAGFRWETGPTPGYRSLNWDQGRLVIPDSLSVDFSGPNDLGLPCTENFAGNGESGSILLVDGIFPVSEPVVFSDGLWKMEVSAGELEIRGARIRYRRAVAESPQVKPGFLLLAGMTLMVIVLLRRARLKTSERTET
jgi:hypothetical protein